MWNCDFVSFFRQRRIRWSVGMAAVCAAALPTFAAEQVLITPKQRANWHESLPGFPTVPFNYGEVRVQTLINQAAQPLKSPVIVPARYGTIQGYQVLNLETNEITYIDSLRDPKCAVYTQYRESGFHDSSFSVASVGSITSYVNIGQINFDNCR